MFCKNTVILLILVMHIAFTQEGPFVYMSLVGTVATADNIFSELCE